MSSSACSVSPAKVFILGYPSASFMMLHSFRRSSYLACEHKWSNRCKLASFRVLTSRMSFSTLSGIIPCIRASGAMALASTCLLKSLTNDFSTSSAKQKIRHWMVSSLRQVLASNGRANVDLNVWAAGQFHSSGKAPSVYLIRWPHVTHQVTSVWTLCQIDVYSSARTGCDRRMPPVRFPI